MSEPIDMAAIAKAIHEARHKGLQSCWAWDDSGLDDEHPGYRESVEKDARAAYAVVASIIAENERIKELMEALKPFAEAANKYNHITDANWKAWKYRAVIGDLRRARFALSTTQKTGE